MCSLGFRLSLPIDRGSRAPGRPEGIGAVAARAVTFLAVCFCVSSAHELSQDCEWACWADSERVGGLQESSRPVGRLEVRGTWVGDAVLDHVAGYGGGCAACVPQLLWVFVKGRALVSRGLVVARSGGDGRASAGFVANVIGAASRPGRWPCRFHIAHPFLCVLQLADAPGELCCPSGCGCTSCACSVVGCDGSDVLIATLTWIPFLGGYSPNRGPSFLQACPRAATLCPRGCAGFPFLQRLLLSPRSQMLDVWVAAVSCPWGALCGSGQRLIQPCLLPHLRLAVLHPFQSIDVWHVPTRVLLRLWTWFAAVSFPSPSLPTPPDLLHPWLALHS